MLNHSTKLIRYLRYSIQRQEMALIEETTRALLDLKLEECPQEEKAIVDALLEGLRILIPMHHQRLTPTQAVVLSHTSLRIRILWFRTKVVSGWPLEAQQYLIANVHQLYLQKQWVHPPLGQLEAGDDPDEYAPHYYQRLVAINTQLKVPLPSEALLQHHLTVGYLTLLPEVLAEEGQKLRLEGSKATFDSLLSWFR